MISKRTPIAALACSAVALVGLALNEGYTAHAVRPVPGDVATVGFGTTTGVRMGDATTPPKALARMLVDVQKYEGAIKQCVAVPLTQGEYDAYVDLTYNIGATAFCGSTIVKRLTVRDYAGACESIMVWTKFKGRELASLVARRKRERATCLGETS